uniref:Uncharacterized protein n=1 Tax=Anguilla anguilla TaxID=7936 RepID=A0A0E9PSU7_ANGAN
MWRAYETGHTPYSLRKQTSFPPRTSSPFSGRRDIPECSGTVLGTGRESFGNAAL